MHHDAVYAFGRLKPHGLPCFTAVQTAEEAAANGLGVARSAFAGSDPNHVRVARVDAHGADRRVGLLVPNRSPRLAGIHAFPKPARSGTRVNYAFVARIRVDGGNAAAHASRAYASEFQVLKKVVGKGLGH